MASSSSMNSIFDSEPSIEESNRKKRRKIDTEPADDRNHKKARRNETKWRSEAQQRIYSSKLIEALWRSRRGSSAEAATTTTAKPGSSGAGEVRGIADRVLATAARGRTRWSRAILASRLRVSRLRKRRKARSPPGCCQLRKPLPTVADNRRKKAAALPAVERRMKVLSRLVPGCRGISVANLLEETGDYIAALEMQIRAMTALTQLLSAGSGSQNGQLGSSSSSS